MNPDREIYVRSFPAMGTRFDMLILGQSNERGELVFQEIHREVDRIENLFSRFRENGPVWKINQQRLGQWVKVDSEELWQAFLTCREYHRKTLGVFDINMGEVAALWKDGKEEPTEDEVAEQFRFSGMKEMEFEESENCIRFFSGKPGIDFGAYAKGYVLEQVRKILLTYEVRQAVINFGDNSILTLGKHPSGEYWPVSVRNPVKLGEILHEFRMNNHAKAFCDYRKMIDGADNLDAVVIATPLHEYAHITRDFLESGIHVFCEKSMARTLEDTKSMALTANRTGKILQIGHQRMFNPAYLKAYERAASGEIGQITQIRAYWHRNNDWRRPVPEGHPELERKINWRMYDEYSAGLMTELASHQIQVANWFLGETPTRVMGSGSICFWKDGREVYDNVACVYDYPIRSEGDTIQSSVTENTGWKSRLWGTSERLSPRYVRFIRKIRLPLPVSFS